MAKRAKLDNREDKKKAATKAAGHGHNGEVSDDLILQTVARLKKLDETQKKAKAAYAQARKQARADGIVLKDLDYAVRQSEKLPEEVADSHNTRVRYMRLLGVEVADNIDLVDLMGGPPKTEEEIVEKAKADGVLAGSIDGKGQGDNPHLKGSPAHEAWADGWKEGQGKIMKDMGLTGNGASSNATAPA